MHQARCSCELLHITCRELGVAVGAADTAAALSYVDGGGELERVERGRHALQLALERGHVVDSAAAVGAVGSRSQSYA